MHRPPGTPYGRRKPGKPQLGDCLIKDVRTAIASNGNGVFYSTYVGRIAQHLNQDERRERKG